MESSTENGKIADSGYSNSSSENRKLQESNEVMPTSMNKKFKKKQKKNMDKTSPCNAESLSEDTTLNTSLKNFDIKKSGEQAKAETMNITNSRGNENVLVSGDKARVCQINPMADYNFEALENFFSVISMSDGLVVFTTPDLYEALGFPEGDTERRCFIDFIHPKDKESFFNHINKIYSADQKELNEGESQLQVTLFCRLRRKNTESNLENGMKKMIQVKPFQFTLYIMDLRNYMKKELLNTTFLVVKAQAAQSAYKEPEEYVKSTIFSTIHTATCQLSHVDSEVVQYFGYLPQDMIGRSFFDFCHPGDLHIIKETYETVLRRSGSSFKSEPYRFIIQNGDFLVLETSFSTYINPWSKKLEFVRGLHRVLKGPMNIDIFDVCDEPTIYSEDVLTKAEMFQKEIFILLQEGVQKNQPAESKNYKYLEPVILNLLNEFQPLQSDNDTGLDDRSFSAYTNTVPRENSPHRELEDSISSTETIPSYHQLNFNANVDRFFNSNLEITATYGNEENLNDNSGDEPEKNLENFSEKKCSTENGGSEQSRSHSAENLRNNFNSQINLQTTSNGREMKNYLTKSLITQHDEKMTNMLIQKYKDIRLYMKNIDKQKKSTLKTTVNETEVTKIQGAKRCRSESEELDDEKAPEKFFVKNKVMKFNHNNTLTSIQNNVNTNIWQSLPFNNSIAISERKNLCLRNNRDKNSAPLPVSQEMIQQNMNYVTESSTETRSQQRNESSVESSTSSFYSSFLSKSYNGTSESEQQRSNEKSELEASFDSKQQCDPNCKNIKYPPPGRLLIDSTDSHDSKVQIWWKNHQHDTQLKEKKPCLKMMMKGSSCIEQVQTISELRTHYNKQQKSLVELLQYDSESLKEMVQPSLVNEQLNQLYCDLKAQSLKVELNIEELEDYDEITDEFNRIEAL